MTTRKYQVGGSQPAYGQPVGGEAEVDPSDPLVQMNIDAGVLVPLEGQPPEVMTCPACVEHGLKRPPKLDSEDALTEHYAAKHAGLVKPTWRAD